METPDFPASTGHLFIDFTFENRDPLKGDGNRPAEAGTRPASASHFENRDPLKGDGNLVLGVDDYPRQKLLFENRDPLKGDGNYMTNS